MVHSQSLLSQCLLQTMSLHLLHALELQPQLEKMLQAGDGNGPGLGWVLSMDTQFPISIKNPYIISTQIFTQGYLNLT